MIPLFLMFYFQSRSQAANLPLPIGFYLQPSLFKAKP